MPTSGFESHRVRVIFMEWKDKLRIMNAVRLGFRHSQTYRNVMARAVSISEFGSRGGKRYICAACKKAFVKGVVEIHHINPVINPLLTQTKKNITIQEFIDRTYCKEPNLQVLCKPCHKIKTHS